MSELHRPRLAILASGAGTTANALVRGIKDGRLNAEVGLVIASKASAGILDLVQKWNNEWGFDVKPQIIGKKTHPGGPRERGQSEETSVAICEAFRENRTDVVLQLGYAIIGNDPYIAEWGFVPGRDNSVFDSKALNWHPGLVPLTADSHGDGASDIMLKAYRAGEITEAGHTVHAVAQEIDMGPVFAEHPVRIEEDDTKESLFQRVQDIEKAVTPYAVYQFLIQQAEYHNNP
jgi:phosphoribosylglycinamide formyltransferase-1